MGLKFAGRTPSRGARFLQGAPRASARVFPSPAALWPLYLAALIVAFAVLVALLRHALGAPAGVGFWPTLLTLPIVLARLAHSSSFFVALWMVIGVLVLGTAWRFFANEMNRRAPDVLWLGLLTFQLFFLARFIGSLLPPAGPLSIAALSAPQKLNFALGLLMVLCFIELWASRPAPPANYGSAPSRVTGFLRRRRLPLRLLGLVMIAFAIIVTFLIARSAHATGTLLRVALLVFVICDASYFVGRALWRRVH